jgi:hypothetical protein
MTKKFVEKTTEEFTYDKEGFVIKKVTTKESYEEGIATIRTDVDMSKYIKVTGVPSTVKSDPWTTTITSSSQLNPETTIVSNGSLNVSGVVDANSIAESVKKALKEYKNAQKY